jgi:myo-inositol-1(or 4)-monophosphatase
MLKHAVALVHRAGAALRSDVKMRKVVREKGPGDIVTKGDLYVERLVVEGLRKLYPDHSYLSEESGLCRGTAGETWILDPIDGTKYFSRQIPLYSISLALELNGTLQIGIVFFPETDELYLAEHGRGARLNGKRIRCSPLRHLEEALLNAEIPSRSSTERERRWGLGKLKTLIECSHRVRVFGVGSLGLCLCASGKMDAYVNLATATKRWDTAAGELIARESGCRYSVVDASIVCAPPALHNRLRRLVSGI